MQIVKKQTANSQEKNKQKPLPGKSSPTSHLSNATISYWKDLPATGTYCFLPYISFGSLLRFHAIIEIFYDHPMYRKSHSIPNHYPLLTLFSPQSKFPSQFWITTPRICDLLLPCLHPSCQSYGSFSFISLVIGFPFSYSSGGSQWLVYNSVIILM